MLSNLQEAADLVTFTEEILNGKLHFLCSVSYVCNIISRKIKLVSKLQDCTLKMHF